MSTETAVTTTTKPAETLALTTTDFNAFGSIAHFEQAQRMARALCSSSIVPENYRGEDKMGNCIIALEIANRIGANILAVMQNLYIVYGRPAWSSQFLISCVNASRKFTPLRYQMTGNKNDDSYGCIAWAQDKTGERLESPEITIAISKAEGWYQKNGSKWKTMPELMLRYRCATLFARLYAPELTMGIQTDDEVIDIGVVDTAPVVTEPGVKKPVFSGPVLEPEVVPARVTKNKPEAPKTKPAPEPTPEPAVVKTEDLPPMQDPLEVQASNPQIVALEAALVEAGIEAHKVVTWCKANKLTVEGKGGLDSIREDKLEKLTKNIKANGPIVAQIKAVA